MPFVRIMIHLIFSTKNRKPLISSDLKSLLLEHIKANSIKKQIYIDTMNCVSDHMHLLISLGSEQTIAKVAMLIKGESSYWVNKNELINTKFEWQDEYIALSVSKSAESPVRNYIKNQEAHHAKLSSQDEYDKFLKENMIEKVWLKPKNE